jgi:RND family efflux transporter MFP subunit
MDKKICLSNPGFNVIFRIGVCILVLAVGLFGMLALAGRKTPPKQKAAEERAIPVRVHRAAPEDVPVFLSGYGEAEPLDRVRIAPEVAGRVIRIHPDLEAGQVIDAGAELFVIDPVNYRAARTEAEASVARSRQQVRRLQMQLRIDRERLQTLRRNSRLAQAEFARLSALFKKERVGTRSGVEKAEQAANLAADQYVQLERAVKLTPIRIQEAKSALKSAKAGFALARANLERCTVAAPFRARVALAAIERGQYVTPGQTVLTLADDSILEIHVPIDSREARKWLQFDKNAGRDAASWFNGIRQVACTVHWTEDPAGHVWEGRLHRVVQFDPETRTLKVAVRVRAGAAGRRWENRFPLVEGMFCRVSIPGAGMKNVFRLPGSAVGLDGTAYKAVDKRLKTIQVEILREQSGSVFVAKGLSPGDLVIITPLIDPLENSLLSYTEPEGEDAS